MVITGGLLWPGDGTGERADAARGASASEQNSEGSTPEPGEESAEKATTGSDGGDPQATPSPAAPVVEDDAASAASALLAQVAACVEEQDPVCAEAVAPGSEKAIKALAPTAAGDVSVDLVDEYGDVAVIRVGSPDGAAGEEGESAAAPEQMLVLVRQDEKWLVRDVYGVADQPG